MYTKTRGFATGFCVLSSSYGRLRKSTIFHFIDFGGLFWYIFPRSDIRTL